MTEVSCQQFRIRSLVISLKVKDQESAMKVTIGKWRMKQKEISEKICEEKNSASKA